MSRSEKKLPAATYDEENYQLAMELAIQLPPDPRRAHAVISRMRRFIEEKYGEAHPPPGVVYCLPDLKRAPDA